MSALEPRMRWWGWGVDRDSHELPASAEAILAERLFPPGALPRRDVPRLEDLRMPEPRGGETLERLGEVVGSDHVRADRLARAGHALGKSYPDLVRIRGGDASSAPDAVVFPGSSAEVAAVLAECARSRIAVVPFGGGTSVVGGVEPVAAGFDASVSIDMRRMNRLIHADRISLLARLEPGLTGPQAERSLRAPGLTLGHFPQSFEFATIGGFVATRSAGQASTGYGRIDELVIGLRCATPSGELVARGFPATAAGPSLRELIVGSEGVLGIITEATLAVKSLPAARRYEAWSFPSFEQGAYAFRTMEQDDAAPDVARLSDEDETSWGLALAAAGDGSRLARGVQRAARRYLSLRGHAQGCLAILGWEGEPGAVGRRRAQSARIVRRRGGVALGRRPGRAWERTRFRAPYLRDALLDRGVMVETLETATSWTNLMTLYRAVRDALTSALVERGTPPIVMCHISHLYRSGASLYFTFLARQEEGEELEQWRTAKSAASDAIVAGGGTITHHHAIGRDHSAWMRAEVGDLGLELLRAAKDRLDPAGVMNPGKLLPPPSV